MLWHYWHHKMSHTFIVANYIYSFILLTCLLCCVGDLYAKINAQRGVLLKEDEVRCFRKTDIFMQVIAAQILYQNINYRC